MRYQTAKNQATNSPSKIEGAGGSMMISSNFPHRLLCRWCSYSPKLELVFFTKPIYS